MLCMKCAGMSTASRQQKDSKGEKLSSKARLEEPSENVNPVSPTVEAAQAAQQANGEKTLKDAVKPKNKRKKKQFSSASSTRIDH